MIDNSQSQRSESYLRTLNLMYVAFLSSQTMVVLATFLARDEPYFNLQDEGNVYLFIVPVFALAGFFAGRLIFQKALTDIALKGLLQQKLAAYSSAFLVRVALIEASTLFAAIAFFLTGNLVLLIVAGGMIFYFLRLRPHRARVEKDLGPTFQEKAVWDNSTGLID